MAKKKNLWIIIPVIIVGSIILLGSLIYFGFRFCMTQANNLSSQEGTAKSLCLQISNVDDKNNCLYYLAYKYTDYKICSSITNESLKMNCISANLYSQYQKNKCSDLQGKDRDMCFAYSAGIEKNKEICTNIQDAVWKNACMNN